MPWRRSKARKSAEARAFRRRAKVIVAIGFLVPTIAGSLVAILLVGAP